MKGIIPKSLRLKLKLVRRFINDELKSNRSKFASVNGRNYNFDHKLTLIQKISKNHLSNNKIENFNIACSEIKKVIIQPGEIFSFWQIVGNPNKRNGYKKGINIISGKVIEDYGGGLCQLSGIIYHISLMAGLNIMERYNHTVYIYTDETRYTPLGSDATVVFGYKDLRFINNYDFPIKFNFVIGDDKLSVHLLSEKPIIKKEIYFKKKDSDHIVDVLTIDQYQETIAKSHYRKN